MRPATTIVLALLLIALFAAAIIQFAVQGSPVKPRRGDVPISSSTSALVVQSNRSSARI